MTATAALPVHVAPAPPAPPVPDPTETAAPALSDLAAAPVPPDRPAELRGRVQPPPGAALRLDTPLVISARRLDGREPAPGATAGLCRRCSGFAPTFLVVTAGQELHIRNEDAICHQFFSSSAPNSFELGLLLPGASRSVRLLHPGFVHLYCSLHAGRETTILVTPGPHFAPVDDAGEFHLRGLAPGRYLLETWNERLPQQGVEWSARSGGTDQVEFTLAAPAAPSR